MEYGYFDNAHREYVITRPDLPTPWLNYLGRGKFSGIISHTAGGMCFDGDPSNRRITRYKYNNLPSDRPGRYLYVRDQDTGRYWSPTWQPVLSPLSRYECRHGLGYTRISRSCEGIDTSLLYTIPLDAPYEVWQVRMTNTTDRARTLRLFSYVEWSWYDAFYDILCDWPRMILQCRCEGNTILFDPVSEQCESGLLRSYLATDLPVDGYDCSLSAFIGPYRSEANPLAVERGTCTNSEARSDNAVGVLSSQIVLQPGETRVFHYALGTANTPQERATCLRRALDPDRLERDLQALRRDWDDYLSRQQVLTPDEDMNTMLNIWNAYQCSTTFDWSRFVSAYERGVDRGMGFRDSMQDVLGILHARPEEARQRILLLLSIQLSQGDAKDVYYPGTGQAKGGGRSDDHLWSVYSVCEYIRETGDASLLWEVVPYVDGGSGTVREHLEQGLRYTRTHLGRHGIPDMRRNDWNDSMAPINKRGGAESVFVFFQLAHAAYELMWLYRHLGITDGLAFAEEIYGYCRSKLATVWDGGWFLRAFTSEGEPYGTAKDDFNRLFLNPQSWAVLSRLPDPRQAHAAFDAVMEHLYTGFGLITHWPASTGYDLDHKGFFAFVAGARENGGIFFHANTWAILALTLLRRGEDAWKCYQSSLPPRRNTQADRCLTEPYVYSQTMLGPQHPRFGACSNSWLTGTASWMYFVATRYILGVRPDYEGLRIDPCIPRGWAGFTATRSCRGVCCRITVQKGEAASTVVDGRPLEGTVIPWKWLEGRQQAEILCTITERSDTHDFTDKHPSPVSGGV